MSRNVLIVEDSPTMRQLLIMALRKISDLTIDEAGDGIAGLQQIREKTYDLVITDINMPMMDGLKLVSLIRQDERHRDTPVVVITTESGEEDRNRAFRLGANAYITKPVRAAQVTRKIRELLD